MPTLQGGYNRTQFVRKNTWRAGGSSSGADQGLFFYIFHVKLRGYKLAVHKDYTTHHFQSPGKPWEMGVGSYAPLLQWPYYKDLPPPGNRTRCARMLSARLRVMRNRRERAFDAANRSGHDVPPGRDPVTRMRYRKFRRQPVF